MSGVDPGQGGVAAVASTATGRQALHLDLRAHGWGEPTDFFGTLQCLPAESRALSTWAPLSLGPSQVLGHLEVEAQPVEGLGMASESPTPLPVASLLPGPGAPPARVEHVPVFGQPVVIPSPQGGCERFEVRTLEDDSCLRRKWCLPGSTFVEVWEVGCTDTPAKVAELSYADGYTCAEHAGHDVVVALDREASTDSIQVLRARVGVR